MGLHLVSVLANLRARRRDWQARESIVSRSAICDASGVSESTWLGTKEILRLVTSEQIQRVIAFKFDLFAYDEICVALLDEQREVLVLLTEESESFPGFIADLPL